MIKIKLKYKNKEYIIEDDYPYDHYYYDGLPYIWEEGNYSCDCNKSLFIINQCDENFPELPCGDEISHAQRIY